MSKMLEEIREQPEALERTLRMGLRAAAKLAREIAKKRPKLIVLAARGTSDNAAQFGRYLLEITTGIPVSLAAPSLYTLYDAKIDLKDALIVAISQSGESTDTNLVLERGREQGALTVGITNELASSLAKLADHLFFVRAGRERSVAATKTYTGQVMSLYLLAYALGAKIRLDDLRKVPDWAAKALELEEQITARAERYRFMERAIVVGRGLNYANAFEFALKLMETCYVVAERFSTADLLHGPIAMVERSFPMFLFAPAGVTWEGMRDMIERLTALKAETLIFTDLANRAAIESGARAVVIPAKLSREWYTPIPYIIPAQIFAASLAEWKGIDPDRPRTLSKVTRTL
ncbi:MAG TPA: SIS domain-containing protein [Bryobacteraceae bacterium]|jgi:glucosamine--fructose-6-phosphate aminotransferase (isomerizing)|nr:SIS domain-containing protein [Bryobacteraceae bacterium]